MLYNKKSKLCRMVFRKQLIIEVLYRCIKESSNNSTNIPLSIIKEYYITCHLSLWHAYIKSTYRIISGNIVSTLQIQIQLDKHLMTSSYLPKNFTIFEKSSPEQFHKYKYISPNIPYDSKLLQY